MFILTVIIIGVCALIAYAVFSAIKDRYAQRRVEREAFLAMKERFMMDNDMVSAMKALMRNARSYSDDRK